MSSAPRSRAAIPTIRKTQAGPTNHGITLATLTHWRGVSCTAEDVQNLSLAEAATIYRALYWRPVDGDALPAGVDLITFDASVNQGPGTAARMLQRAAKVDDDGDIGPATLAAVAALDPVVLIANVAAERMASYRQECRLGA